MSSMKEEALRRAILVAAGACWAVSLTLSWLIIAKVIDNLKHPGLGLVVFMAQGLAVTLTIVWAQLRNSHVVTEAFKTGMEISKIEESK